MNEELLDRISELESRVSKLEASLDALLDQRSNRPVSSPSPAASTTELSVGGKSLPEYLADLGLDIEIVDKRSAGGGLWVFGDNAADVTEAVNRAQDAFHISFTYSKKGSRTTNRKSGYFTK